MDILKDQGNAQNLILFLAFIRKNEKILVAGYFDDLITMNSIQSWDNISKITFIKTRLCYTSKEINFQPLPGN